MRKRQKKPLTRKQKIISRVIVGSIAACSVVLCVSVAVLMPKLKSYHDSDVAFNDIASNGVVAYEPVEAVSAQAKQPENLENALTIDWDAYSGTEIVAWFQMDDISYPIMQHDDNQYYLNHLPDGSYNSGGTLFLLAENNALFSDSSCFVYGHNMGNGSMFGSLKHYTSEDFKGHPFYIYLPDGTRHTYTFYSVKVVDQNADAYTWSFASEESFLDWQKKIQNNSLVSTDCQPSKDAHYVTLSTCNGSYGTTNRLIVCGQECAVDQLQDPASWYESYAEQLQASKSGWTSRSQDILNELHSFAASSSDDVWKKRGVDA